MNKPKPNQCTTVKAGVRCVLHKGHGLDHAYPVLLPGIIYSADNGRLICLKCAGMSAKFTGHDISGLKCEPVPWGENAAWRKEFGKPISCEAGCLTYEGQTVRDYQSSWAKLEAERPPSLLECLDVLVSLKPMVEVFRLADVFPEADKNYRALLKRLDDAIKGGAR